MSIYAVKLSEWYPFGDEMYEFASSIVRIFRCYACGKKARYSKAVGLHSLPFGHGDVYCNWKCYDSGKVARPDRRRERRLRRRDPEFYKAVQKLDVWIKNSGKTTDA